MRKRGLRDYAFIVKWRSYENACMLQKELKVPESVQKSFTKQQNA